MEMSAYRVSWEIDVVAASPREAAEEANRIVDRGMARVYTVQLVTITDDGMQIDPNTHVVDLSPDGPLEE